VSPSSRDVSLSSRTTGRAVAGAAAIAALGWSLYAGITQSIPAWKVYDGLWMLLWATVAVAAVAPVIWSWRRERSLAVVALAAILGCWLPLVVSAVRHQMPVLARIRGAWVLAGADVVGLTAPVGFVCLWLALREHRA